MSVGETEDVVREVQAAFGSSPLVAELTEIIQSGDFSRFESSAKRQHFVPQLLLRRFSRGSGDAPPIFELDTTSGRPRRTNTRVAASRHYLYAFFEEGGDRNNQIEGYLSRVESHAAPALRRLLEEPTSLTGADRATLSLFLGVQMQRTPAAAAQVTELANAFLRTEVGSRFSNRAGFADDYHEFFGDDGKTEEEIEAFRLETIRQARDGRMRIVDGGGAAFSTSIRHAAELSLVIFELGWTMLRCEGGFVTSDRAFAIHDPSPPHPFSAAGVLSSPHVETTIPLAEDACLLLTPDREGIVAQDISLKEAERLNLRTYGWADQFIYGPTQDAVATVRKAAKAHPRDVVRPKPQPYVVLIDADPGDNTFADANMRKGWAPRLLHEGVWHDYIVIPSDRPAPEVHERVDRAVEQRMRKALGIAEDEPLPGGITTKPIHPLDMG
jgi:Protein of unknown function (DUF4238)